MIDVATSVALVLIVVAAALFMVRILTSRSLANAIVALDALLLTVASGLAVYAARTGDSIYLNAMLVTALLAFVGTVLVAKYIEHRGS